MPGAKAAAQKEVRAPFDGKPIATVDAVERVDEWVKEAVEAGAKLVSGGAPYLPPVMPLPYYDNTAFRVDWMPFAGLRESGLGVGGIPYTFHDMQIEKMLVGVTP